MARYAEARQADFDEAKAFRSALERSACCAVNTKDSESSDPLNVVQVGKIDDIGATLVRRGSRTDRLDFDDAQRLFGRRPYSAGLGKLGSIGSADPGDVTQPRRSLAGSAYCTDALRAVMVLVTRPLALSDVPLLDEIPWI